MNNDVWRPMGRPMTMNNEIIKLISGILHERETLDWNSLEINTDTLERLTSDSLENPALFELGDSFKNAIDRMKNEIAEILYYNEFLEPDLTVDEQNERHLHCIDALRMDIDRLVRYLKKVLPDSKCIYNYDVLAQQKARVLKKVNSEIHRLVNEKEFYVMLHGLEKFESDLKCLRDQRDDVRFDVFNGDFARGAPERDD